MAIVAFSTALQADTVNYKLAQNYKPGGTMHYKFRLRAGKHTQQESGGEKTYVPGDLVESSTDLAERFGPKFERVYQGEGEPSQENPDSPRSRKQKP